ncbi:hypothetical protein BDV24DRAFT_141900 [Aspergillus arachidicola]|uniref:Uncharacterized protein n=1 Tax=Aspergillus arachidicola TaxID=656916 RepID=A0A5N6XT92_9EURO|nr:hypothetical protein BDV24DRAFT_141900 [Aspergillus arachidicola]
MPRISQARPIIPCPSPCGKPPNTEFLGACLRARSRARRSFFVLTSLSCSLSWLTISSRHSVQCSKFSRCWRTW